MVAAHHDSAPGAPAAYDDGGGVGILIELARILGHEPARTRTIVFASFDGEESEATGKGATAGSRAFIERLGPRARNLVAAFAIEMSGWAGGTPVVHPIAYRDPRERDRSVIAPAWLVRAALAGSREAGAPLGVGDPRLSWVYQPAVRTFRVRLYGDDLSFLQAGHPALFASDSSFCAFYPYYHQATRHRRQARRGRPRADGQRRARGRARDRPRAARARRRSRTGSRRSATWSACRGSSRSGILSLLPGLRAGVEGRGRAAGRRASRRRRWPASLLWLQPVPALWVLLVPAPAAAVRARVVGGAPRPRCRRSRSLGLGGAAWWRGAVSGVWLAPWEIAVAFLALALAFVTGARGSSSGGEARDPRRKAR